MRSMPVAVLVVLLSLKLHPANAQTISGEDNPQLYTIISNADLTPAQGADLAKLRALKPNSEIKVIDLNVSALRTSPQIVFPGFDVGVTSIMKMQTVDSVTGDAATRIGVAPDVSSQTPLPPGKQSIFHIEGKVVFGSIYAADAQYAIRPLGGGSAHALIKIDPSSFPPEHPPQVAPDPLKDLPPESGALEDSKLRHKGDENVYDIAVLVGYTPAVAAAVSPVAGLIGLSLDSTNTSYAKSNIRAKLILAGTIQVPFQETGDFQKDLAALRALPVLQAERTKDSANVVVVLVNDNAYCGLAAQILATSRNAYAIVYHECAADNLSFAHEIGHLQGARHNPEIDGASSPFPYGHGFMNGSQHIRDIMSYDCPEGCQRMPIWSAPPSLGTTDVSDAARVLDQTAPYISSLH